MPNQYFYPIFAGFMLIIWIILYLLRSDVRKEMLTISPIIGIAGPIYEYFHIQDWWKPETITGTNLGPEDYIIGFAIGGISSVIYKEIFKKNNTTQSKAKNKIFCTLLILCIIIFLAVFYILKLGSALSVFISLLLGTSIILFYRKDLITASLVTGLLMVCIGTMVYWLLLIFQPGFIEDFWYLDNVWYAKLILGIPLAEYLWYFLVGTFIGPLYEFWHGKRLVDLK